MNNEVCSICLHKDPGIDISENVIHIPCNCNIYCHKSCYNRMNNNNYCFICKRKFKVEWGNLPTIDITDTSDISENIIFIENNEEYEHYEHYEHYENNENNYSSIELFYDMLYYGCCDYCNRYNINYENICLCVYSAIVYIGFIILGLMVISVMSLLFLFILYIGGLFFNMLLCININSDACINDNKNPILFMYGIIGAPLLYCIFICIKSIMQSHLTRIENAVEREFYL